MKHIRLIGEAQHYPYDLNGLRGDFPNVSFPEMPDTTDLSAFGVFPVQETVPAAHNPVTHRAVDSAVLVGQTWTQQWTLVERPAEEAAANLAQAKAQKWEAIKAIRDRKTQEGGYLAEGNWFHSDVFSRVQQLGLVMMGNGVPPGLQWKTMSGDKVPMTPQKAGKVFAAAAAQDAAMFAHAETLKAQVDASDNPATVDINVGWPATYE
jgi:hypothetical protein